MGRRRQAMMSCSFELYTLKKNIKRSYLRVSLQYNVESNCDGARQCSDIYSYYGANARRNKLYGTQVSSFDVDKHFKGLFRFLSDPFCGFQMRDKH